MSQNFTRSKWPLQLFVCALAFFSWFTPLKAQLAMTRSGFTGTYTPLTTGSGATVSTVTTDDGVQTNIPIGFSFNYLGTAYTSVAVCANGWVSFNATTTSTSFTNTDMYTTSGPNNALFPWFDDLSASVNSILGAPSILFQTQGVPGNQTFTVQWTNFSSYRTGVGSALNFQVILYEGTNVIEFQYGPRTIGTLITAQSASIGIENATGGPGNYMDAMTGSSKCGHFYLNEFQWPQYFFRFTPGAPTVLASGTYNVGVGQTYPNLTEALCDVQQRGISGPVTLNLTDATYDTSAANGANFFPLLLGPVTGASSTNVINITKSGSPAVIRWGGAVSGATNGAMMNGTTSSINGSNVEPIFGLVGADFVNVSNLDIQGNVGPKNADHAIGVYNNTATDGATNNTFTNISVTMRRQNTGSRGIFQNTSTTATSAAGANSNNIYKNLTIKNVYAGIHLNGTSAFPDLNNEIGTTSCGTYNTIGDPSTANDIGNSGSQTFGIRAQNQSGVKIYNNSIRNVTASAAQADGIFLESFQGTPQVYNNKIQTIKNSSTSSAATAIAGIRASHATTGTHTARIYNNAVSEIISAYTGSASSTRTLKGIFISGTGGSTSQTYEIYNNSVSIDGSSSPNLSSTCFEISTTSGPVYKLGNNVFANFTAAQTGVARHYVLVSTSATSFGATGTTSNNNDLYIQNDAGTTGFVGLGSSTTYTTIANWTAAMTPAGLETASISFSPFFTNNISDLHTGAGALNNTGLAAPAYVTTDLECAARTDNDMGAYINAVPACSGTPTAGTITGLSTICSGTSTTLTLSSPSVESGISYQWAFSTTAGGPYTPLAGGLTQSTGTLTATTYYVVTTTCSFSGLSNTTPEFTLAVNPLPTVSISPASATYCSGGPAVALTASGASTYTWSPSTGLSATTGATVNASPGSTTAYTITGTSAAGCVGTPVNYTVTVAPGTTISSVTATPSSVCFGANSQLNVAAVANATAADYIFSTSTGATLDPMTGATTVIGSGADDTPMASPAAIGFNFVYEGVTYTQFSASPDGWIRLGGGAASSQFTNSVTSATNTPKLYPYWDDLATGTTGNVQTLVTGTAPNRIFIVQWFVTIPRATGGPANSTYQAWLYETSNKIEFRYGTMGTPSSASASAGITGATSTKFNSITYSSNTSSASTSNDNNTDAPASGRMYTFTPPTIAYNWTPSTFITGQETLSNPMATGVTSSTTYTVTASIGSCSSTGTVTVNVGTPLVCGSITTPSLACSGQNFNLSLAPTGGGAPYSYAWSDGVGGVYPDAASITPNLPAGTYNFSVTVTDACSNTCTSTVTVTVNPTPSISVTPTTGNICVPGGSPVSLTASGASTTYSWTPSAGLSATTGATVTANPTATTTYTVSSTDAVGCTGSATAMITVTPTATVTSVTATPPAICSGANSQLNAVAIANVNAAGYVFSTSTGAALDPMTGATTVIGSSDDDTPMASPASIGFNFMYEGVTYTQFSASPDGWIRLGGGAASSQFTNAVTSATNTPKLYPYWDDLATGSNGNVKTLVTGTAPNRIFIIQWFVTIPRNTTGAANSTYQAWLYESSNKIEFRYGTMGTPSGSASAGITGATSTNFNSITFSSNTSSASTANDANPDAPASGRMYVFSSPVLTYNWTPSTYITGQETLANPLATGLMATTTYTVTASFGACSDSDTVTVNVGSPLVCSSITAPSLACSGQNFTLSTSPTGGGAPYSYAWSDGVGGVYPDAASITPNLPAGTYTFTVTVTDACGSNCSSNVTVTVNPTPSLSVTPSSDTLCVPGGSPVSLTASGASTTYSWTPSAGLSATTGATVTANPTVTTTYTVSSTDAVGCTGSATAMITVGPSVTISSVTATPASICTGANSQLNVAAVANITAAGYLFSTSTGAALDPMTGATTVIGSSVDDTPMGTPASIGFNFVYEGVTYTQFSASPDGWIRLGGGTATSQFTNAVTSATNTPKLYPYWDDLATGTTGNVQTLVTGTAPNRIFIIQWFVTIPRNTTGAANSTFQAWLYETSNKIEFHYGTMGTPTSGSISSGITGATSTNFNSITFSSNTSSASAANNSNADAPASGRMYVFSYPTLTYNWTPSTYIAGQETLANPLASAMMASTTYNVTVSAGACSSTGSVTVNVGTPLVCGTITTPGAVCDGQSFSLSLAPTGGGAPYSYTWSDGIGGVYPDAASITATLPAGTYNFSVTVNDACGNTCSTNTTVTVNPSPAGTASGPSTGVTYQNLTYVVTGYPAGSTFQWQSATVSGGPYTNIAGATNDSLTIAKNASGTFYYVCVVTLGSCNITTNQVTTVISVAGDNVCNAVPLSLGLNGPFTNVGATTEAGEAAPPNSSCTGQSSWCNGISNTVWFTFVAPPSGKASIHFILPNWDSEIALWSAADCNALLTGGGTLIAANDDSTGSSPFNAFIDVTCLIPGNTYYVQVDGWGSTTNSGFNLLLNEHTNAAPTISGMPTDMTLTNDPGNCGAVVNWTDPTISDPDNCVPSLLSLTSTYNSGDMFPIGTTTVTYTATDGVTTIDSSFTVTVTDTEFPVFSSCPSDTTFMQNNTGCTGIYTWTAPTVSDNCASPSFTASHTSGFAFPVGTTTVTYTSTDANGNTTTCSFNVTVTNDLATTVNSITDETCNGGTTGAVDVSVTGVATPYTYDWSNDGTGDTDDTQDLSSIAAGTYTLVVHDAGGCTDTTMVTITEPAAITSTQTFTICNGTSITVGTNTYSIPGTYTDVFTATNGCDSTVTTILNVNPPVNIGTSVSGNTITANSTVGTYQWVNCATNTNIAGATGQIFVAPSNGSYSVIVTESGCSDTSTCVVINVGINELHNNQSFGLYPNPTTGLFTITASTEAQMTMVNAIGEVLMTGRINKGDNKFDAGHLARGIYMIRLSDANGNLMGTQRLTITK